MKFIIALLSAVVLAAPGIPPKLRCQLDCAKEDDPELCMMINGCDDLNKTML